MKIKAQCACSRWNFFSMIFERKWHAVIDVLIGAASGYAILNPLSDIVKGMCRKERSIGLPDLLR